MPPALFNHTLHERNEDCSSCHHSTVRQACSSCHTQEGGEKGHYVSLAQAMHSDNPRFTSCVSCHEEVKASSPECAGCHAIQPARAAPDCGFCHQRRTPADRPAFVSGRPAGTGFVLEIGRLSEEYGKVEFAHSAHVQRLTDIIGERAPGMSAAHLKNHLLCQSCHHNSSPETRPECASCHPASTSGGNFPPDGRPLLKAAYHQLCMDCHTRMEVKAVPAADCSACHQPLPGKTALRE
jgi:predicted CXXCH cytochrome family protein